MNAIKDRCNRCDMPAVVRLQLANKVSGRVLTNEQLCDDHRRLEETLEMHGLPSAAQRWARLG